MQIFVMLKAMKYILDEKAFRTRLTEFGYKNFSEFALKNNMHRNTLIKLIKGKDVFCNAFAKLTAVLKVDPLSLLTHSPAPDQDVSHMEEIEEFLSRLHARDKDLSIFLLGSRARGRAQEYSDWDIGVFRYPKSITGIEYLRLKREIEDQTQDLLRSVDLVNLNQAPGWFLENTMNDGFVFLKGNVATYHYFMGVLDGIRKAKVA